MCTSWNGETGEWKLHINGTLLVSEKTATNRAQLDGDGYFILGMGPLYSIEFFSRE